MDLYLGLLLGPHEEGVDTVCTFPRKGNLATHDVIHVEEFEYGSMREKNKDIFIILK